MHAKCGASNEVSVTIVVLSHNRMEELSQSIPKLLDICGKTGFELVVVDNDSSDGSREYLDELSSDCLSVILSEENLGVAGGRNRGWGIARGEFILNIDDDTRIELEAIDQLRAHLLCNATTGIAYPAVVHPLTGVFQTPDVGEGERTSNFHGACHLVRTVAYRQIGPLDAGCVFGGEELDYSIRALESGWEVDFLPSVRVFHNSVIREKEIAMDRRIRWVYNYCRVLAKHFPAPDAFVYSGRVLMRHSLSAAKSYGLRNVSSLVTAAFSGWRSGRSVHHTISPSTRARYSDRRMTPDFGNRSILSDVFRKVSG